MFVRSLQRSVHCAVSRGRASIQYAGEPQASWEGSERSGRVH